jgi:hypothetical protein
VVESVSRENGEAMVSLQVSGAWKGVASPQMTVRTPEHPVACGFDFEVGGSYLVYADERSPQQGGGLTTTRCTRTGHLAEAGADLSVLGPAAAPSEN